MSDTVDLNDELVTFCTSKQFTHLYFKGPFPISAEALSNIADNWQTPRSGKYKHFRQVCIKFLDQGKRLRQDVAEELGLSRDSNPNQWRPKSTLNAFDSKMVQISRIGPKNTVVLTLQVMQYFGLGVLWTT